MARKVVWSNIAASDLDEVARYIARDSRHYAAAFVQEILEVSRSLAELSERGRIVPEISRSHVRELLVRDYRLLYVIEKSRVAILGLIHGKRDLKRI